MQVPRLQSIWPDFFSTNIFEKKAIHTKISSQLATLFSSAWKKTSWKKNISSRETEGILVFNFVPKLKEEIFENIFIELKAGKLNILKNCIDFETRKSCIPSRIFFCVWCSIWNIVIELKGRILSDLIEALSIIWRRKKLFLLI